MDENVNLEDNVPDSFPCRHEKSYSVSSEQQPPETGTSRSHTSNIVPERAIFFYTHFKMAATYRCRLVTSIQTPISTGSTRRIYFLLPVKMSH